jgi:hypothetical protein
MGLYALLETMSCESCAVDTPTFASLAPDSAPRVLSANLGGYQPAA